MADVEFGPSLTDPAHSQDNMTSWSPDMLLCPVTSSGSFDLKTRFKSNKEKPNKLLNITDFVSLISLTAENNMI